VSYTSFRFKAPILKGLSDVQLSEPTPELKEVLKLCSTGQDLIIASTQKDHAEKGPFIWTMNELSKSTLGYGTRILVLCNDETRVKKVVTFLRKLGEQIAFDAEPILADMEAQKVSNIIGKAPHAIVGTPAVLKEALEANRTLYRDLHLLYMMGAHKMESLEDVKAIFPRILSPKKRVVQLGKKATLPLRHEVLTWAREPHHIGIDPPIEGLEPVVTTKAAPETPTKPAQEASNKPAQETSTAQASEAPTSTVPASEAPTSTAPTPAPSKAENQPKKEDQEVQDKTTEGRADVTSSSKTADAPSEEDHKALIDVITPLLKRAMIPNDLPLATVVKRIKESPSQRMVVFCQGPAEADALFKELREADLGVISVHSKLRRSTYEYRLNRFQSGEVNAAIIGGRLKAKEPLKQVKRALYTLLPRSKDTFMNDMGLIQWSESPQEVLFLIQEKEKESFETFKEDSGLECTPLVLDGLSELKPVELLDRRKEQRTKDRSKSSKGTKNGSSDSPSKDSKSKRTNKGERGGKKSQGNSSGSTQKGKKGSSQHGRGGQKNAQGKGRGKGKRSDKPKTPYGLPRANFDRLDGGKEGSKSSGGLFGTIKKLFGS